MLQYKEATIADIEQIAFLHADSWRRHYKGIWSNEFLDNAVYQDRLDTWRNRLASPAQNQYTLLAMMENKLQGFACIYTDDDPVFGSLLDNLHVTAEMQGRGTGTQLIKLVAKKMYDHNPSAGFYLWVLEENYKARKFYEYLGGKNHEVILMENPDKSFSSVCRYTWADISALPQ